MLTPEHIAQLRVLPWVFAVRSMRGWREAERRRYRHIEELLAAGYARQNIDIDTGLATIELTEKARLLLAGTRAGAR